MDNETIETLLHSLDLQDDIETFKKEDIDIETLKCMTDDDLKEMGLSKGKRMKILKKIESTNIRRRNSPLGSRGAQRFSYEEDFQKRNIQEMDEMHMDWRKEDHCVPPRQYHSTNQGRMRGFNQVVSHGQTDEYQNKSFNKANVKGCLKPSAGDFMEKEIRIVLIGKTGSGKSASGNTILGEKLFESSISGSSVTSVCSQKHAVRFDKKILVVDTPGIFDTRHSVDKIQNEIVKCITITSPGPHAFILVLSLTRYTEEEHKSVMHFVKHFGEDIYTYFIILFTRKDDLDDEGISLLEHIRTVPPELTQFIQKCGGRVMAFNNKLKGEEKDAQVVELLSMILDNVKRNEGKCYTDKMYSEAEKLIRKREEEDLRKAKEKREKEVQAIESRLADKYNKQIQAEQRKNQETLSALNELRQEQNNKKSESIFLQQQIEDLKKQLNESKGKEESKEMTQILKMLQNELADKKENVERSAKRISELEKSKETEEKKLTDLQKEHESDKRKLKEDTEKELLKVKESARDKIREEVEKEKGFFSLAKDLIVCGLKKLNPFNWFK